MTERHEDHTVSIRAEQAVLGSLLLDNDALGRIGDVEPAHFYRHDHRLIFEEIQRQVIGGRRADPMTVFGALNGKVDDCLPYLGKLRASAVSSANIVRHAEMVSDKAASIGAYQDERTAFRGQQKIKLGGARMPILFPGEKINAVTAARPNSNFKDFESAVLRNFAAGTRHADRLHVGVGGASRWRDHVDQHRPRRSGYAS